MGFRAICWGMFCFLLSTSISFAEKKEATSNVILILDASGSMWGQIDGKPKINIAREVVRGLVKDWDKDSKLGLVTYGHRKKGDCKDIETLIPVSSLKPKSFLKAVEGIHPKGKTPMTQALKQAAEALKYSEESATVILVSDGKETCDLDPCAVSKKLEETGIDFTAHVIGFDVKEKKTIEQLKCIAENTGGQFILASNASDLKKAFKKTIKKVKETALGLKLSAFLKKGGKPLEKGLSWAVYEAQVDELGKRKRVTYSYHAAPSKGNYLITVSHGSASTSKEITVAAGEVTKENLIFGAGNLLVVASLSEESKPLEGGLSWTVYEAQADELGKRKRITYSYDAKPNFKLLSGKVLVTVKHGSARTSKELEIESGKVTKANLILNAGLLNVGASLKKGGKPLEGGLSWTVYEAQADELGKRKRVTYSYDSNPTFKLPKGRYLLSVGHGSASTSKEIEVSEGKVQKDTLVLKAGYLKAKSVSKGKGITSGLSWTVYEAQADELGKRKRVTYSYDSNPTFKLPSGKYLINVSHGSEQGSEEFKVKPGEIKDIELKLKAK